MFEWLESVISPIILAVVIGVGGYVINYHRKKSRAEETLRDEVNEIRKAQWRIAKTLIIITKLIDEQVQSSHPEITIELEDIAKELLSNGKKTSI